MEEVLTTRTTGRTRSGSPQRLTDAPGPAGAADCSRSRAALHRSRRSASREQAAQSEVSRRVAVIGLDCADPKLVFDRWLDELPNIRGLVERGTWGPLRSVDPPITVPAWSCMLTGRDPGELGIYGFRNRRTTRYDALGVADSRARRRRPRVGSPRRGRAST